MKLALVQMRMEKEIAKNLDKSLKYCDMAKGCELVFFPEIQLTPFSRSIMESMQTRTAWTETMRPF